MGQKASRALAGRLEKGMQKYRGEMEKDILQNIKEKQRAAAKGNTGFTDPNAMDAGFTRGMSAPIRQDQEQEAFLKSQSSNTAENQELPDDLIQFLNDMGPVERKERKPRLRKHQQEELDRLEEQQDEGRQIREMPIMEDVAKFTTSRTTNFSRRQEEEDKFAGLTGRQLYRLLQDDNKEATIASLIQESNVDDDEKKVYSDLLQNTLKYLKIPVIMKDTDATYVGVPEDKVEDMKKLKLTEVPESEVRILLSVEDPGENEIESKTLEPPPQK
jgi:hypothetical protein